MIIKSAQIKCTMFSTTVYVTFDNGETRALFDYFRDEIHFSAREFIGLTVPEAIGLKASRDRAYLR